MHSGDALARVPGQVTTGSLQLDDTLDFLEYFDIR
jgi:hypothetical protein